MKELELIIAAYDRAIQEGKQCVLVTLVHVDGSSYRRPGARMLVTEDGEMTGAISGGCLEGDALNKALLAMRQQRNTLVTYDTTDDDDAMMGLGLGCNGVIQVLMQPLTPANSPMQLLKKVAASRKYHVLVTLFNLKDRRAEQPGTCVLEGESESECLVQLDPAIIEMLSSDVAAAHAQQRSIFTAYHYGDTELTAYVEHLAPPLSLVVAGAGNDVEPLVSMATVLGWKTTLIDDGRGKNMRADRFAGACHLKAPKAEDAMKQVVIDDMSVFILMTHNYHYDLSMLKQLLPKKPKYIGMLGPRKKMERMLCELAAEGLPITPEQLSVIYNPAGLDIGAESPEEIALSIIAEIKSVMAGKGGESLRNSREVIHPRDLTKIEKKKIYTS